MLNSLEPHLLVGDSRGEVVQTQADGAQQVRWSATSISVRFPKGIHTSSSYLRLYDHREKGVFSQAATKEHLSFLSHIQAGQMVSHNTETSGWADLKPLLSLGSTHQDTTSQKTLPGPFQQSVHPSSWTSAQPRAGHSNSPELFKQCCWRSEHPRSPQSTLLNLSLSPESPKCFNSNNNKKKTLHTAI